jgi:7,8-dihydropterin-6-yl-methyl-4-(beta-D-ribofuranosyl)aminobenzene 5'-phosphate synthase
MRITVLVDDIGPEDARPVHGFSALVEAGGQLLLFDTGPNGDLLMDGLERMGVGARDLDGVVISHAHRDHTGGLARVLYDHPRIPVSVPVRVSKEVSMMLPRETLVMGDDRPRELAPGVTVTGDMGGTVPEQCLIVETDGAPVVVVGCAHSGLDGILEHVGGEARLLIGGFHDLSNEDAESLGWEAMMACHCTPSKRMLSHRFDRVMMGSVGTEVEIDDPTPGDPQE